MGAKPPPIKGGPLFPEADFTCIPLDMLNFTESETDHVSFLQQRWQRRWFVLYDDGELTYSVDDHVSYSVHFVHVFILPEKNVSEGYCFELFYFIIIFYFCLLPR